MNAVTSLKPLSPGLVKTTPAPVSATWRKSAPRFAPELSMLRLIADPDEELDTAILEREFPTVSVDRGEQKSSIELTIDDFAWRGSFDNSGFDDAIERARPLGLIAVRGADAAGVAREVLARYQRLILRRNEASSSALFDAVLGAHAALFEELATEREHALDTWQWMLRVDPTAGVVAQLAALLHDVGRLEGDPNERIEHRVHRALDDARGKCGGERAQALLVGAGVDEQTATRVKDLVSGQAEGTHDAVLLDDADSLSFLSLGSARYADHFGLAQTRRKVSFLLGRLSETAREKVSLFRLRPDVERLVRAG